MQYVSKYIYACARTHTRTHARTHTQYTQYICRQRVSVRYHMYMYSD